MLVVREGVGMLTMYDTCSGVDPDLRVLSAATVLREIHTGEWSLRIHISLPTGEPLSSVWGRRVVSLLQYTAGRLYIEMPTANDARSHKIRANDLVRLAACAGTWFGASGSAELVEPVRWKGTMPKGIVQRRAYKALGIPFKECGGKDMYIVPDVADPRVRLTVHEGKLLQTHWKDISDSVALAWWGWKRRYGA
jgi:hypothetical protein